MVKQFLMNLLLAFTWVALTGTLYFSNFLFGYATGFFLMWVMNRNEQDHRYFNRVPKIIGFFLYFLYQLIRANIQVAYDIVTPNFYMRPGIVKYPMNARSEIEINLLSTVISLTPGTLIIDVSEDQKVLYIHVMYLKDKEQFIQQIKDGFERRLLEILR
ncbi:Na+/H+ antiporter subunit E [Parapedobacter deserti]|uniref:Na+/H+ antiporter subunit E n=1 Tax=Parapedobacter deserti TaxID=1912957 RepID=A0ABV7JGM7_9SPHI